VRLRETDIRYGWVDGWAGGFLRVVIRWGGLGVGGSLVHSEHGFVGLGMGVVMGMGDGWMDDE